MNSIEETASARLGAEERKKIADRNSKIVHTSLIGVGANLLLALFKAVVGFASHSIAIVMDAVNNLSDASSSIITIVGTRLAEKQPDKKHPFGHGRIEYISAMLISMLVLYAGLTALIESVKKIVDPTVPDYSAITLTVVSVAVIVKIILGRYVKSVGEKVHSDSLVNSGADAMLDAVISTATLIAAVIFIFFHVSLEAWLGAAIALVIIKSGLEMLQDTVSKILGERAELSLMKAIKTTINSYPEISGAYDLILHNYGPDLFNGSVHIEVPDTLSADELDKLIRRVSQDVYEKHDVILTAVGVYSLNTKDPEAVKLREEVSKVVLAHKYVNQIHGFYYDREEKSVRFDIVISFDAPDRYKLFDEVCASVREVCPGFTVNAAMDMDLSEI